MKVQIEKAITLNVQGDLIDKISELNTIIILMNNAIDEIQLKSFMNDQKGLKYFIYGFGAHHMWVHENENDGRILFVEF